MECVCVCVSAAESRNIVGRMILWCDDSEMTCATLLSSRRPATKSCRPGPKIRSIQSVLGMVKEIKSEVGGWYGCDAAHRGVVIEGFSIYMVDLGGCCSELCLSVCEASTMEVNAWEVITKKNVFPSKLSRRCVWQLKSFGVWHSKTCRIKFNCVDLVKNRMFFYKPTARQTDTIYIYIYGLYTQNSVQ